MGYDDQFPSPTLLFSHAATSSKGVCSPGKNYWLESVSFLLEVNFLQKTMIQSSIGFLLILMNLKNIVEEILKNLQFFQPIY